MYVIKKYEFEPDYTNVIKVANNIWVDRVPVYDHIIGGKVIYEITGNKPYETWFSSDRAESRNAISQVWDFWKLMGYDTVSMEFSFCSILEGNGCLGGHVEGCIKDRADFERYPWDGILQKYIDAYKSHIEDFVATCPAGMKLIGGVGNGVFESVQDIIGYQNLCYIKADEEQLYADIFKKMGEEQYKVWDWLMTNYGDLFCVARFGDDLGFKSQTLISPQDIHDNIVPVYKKIIDRVHADNKPFLLHSCGNLFDVMDDLIDNAGINAKHSNEDAIAHFSVWVDKFGDRIGNFGGIDTDVICGYSPEQIREYVHDCLNKCKGKGGIAFGCGNSIPDYVPTEGYVAMNNAVREWRGDK